MLTQVLIHWGISSYFGWGVYGLNLALHWSNDPDLEPVCSRPIQTSGISLDPLRFRLLQPFIEESARFDDRLKEHVKTNSSVRVDVPLLMPLGDDFIGLPTAYNTSIEGSPTIGVAFFEDPNLTPEAVARASQYTKIITGSSWNESVLRSYGVNNVETILQGVDSTLFHPAPRSGMFRDKFLIFSGGKLEFRKGQDLVLRAFREFAKRHPDAVLVTAWHSPWPQTARTLDSVSNLPPVPSNKDGKIDVAGWARVSGIPTDQFLDLGSIPNSQMPQILREMDVAVFPNRGEGGTNLVAMECMACGTPVILSANTGHLDLIQEGNCYPLNQQSLVNRIHKSDQVLTGWGESSVPEIIEHLERIYSERKTAKAIGLRGAEMAGQMSWQSTADALKTLVMNQVSRVN